MKLLVLSVLVAALAFASADQEFRKRQALRALEEYANSMSNSLYYLRAVGEPSLRLEYGMFTRGRLTDVLLSKTSCTQQDAAEFSDIIYINELNEKCPPAGDNVTPLMKCSITVTYVWDSVRVVPELTECGRV